MQNRAKTKGLNPLVKESGNVFLMLFGAVAMVGVLGASTMTILKGPVRTMSQVTKQTLAENNAITTARLSISSATIDCDGDGVFEPLEFGAAIPGFTGGGQIPGTLGVSRQDPWGNEYGYCVWDNATVDDGGCGGATQGRLAGDAGAGPYKEYVIAVVSAGPNGNYDTSCNDYAGAGTQINKAGDDIVFGYAYDDAADVVGGIWTDVGGGVGAEIGRDNITVRDTTVAEDIQFAIDTAMKTLTLGDGSTGIQGAAGIGKFPRVEADFLQSFNNANIGVLAPIASDSNITTTANISGANLAASGTLGVTGVSTLGTVVAGATSTSTLSSSGLATLNSLSVTNNGAIGGTFDVTGLSTFTGTANFDGDMRLGSDAADTIDVQGTMTIDTLSVTNNATIGGTLGVTGNTLLSTLTTSGLASLNSATMAGTIDMNSNTIIDVPDPANPLEVANKQYVDAEIAAVTSGGVTEDDPFVEDVLNTGELCIGKAGNIVGCDVTTVTSFETDPTIGTVTDGELCAWNNSTSKIECNTDPSALTTAETDPQVEDTLNTGELCIGKAGNIVGCDITAVTSFETDPTISATLTSGELCTWNGTQIQCNTATGSVGAPGLFTDNTTYITRENFNIIDSGQTSTTTLLDGNGGATAGAFYDPNKYALRGGEITGTNDAWEDTNVGANSFAWGVNSEGSGDSSTAFGLTTTASGSNSVALGYLSRATGYGSIALGRDIRVGIGVGQTTDANADVGNYSIGFGLGDASTVTPPQITANETMAIFFGDQQGEDITATNVLALEGGSLLLSNDSGSACAMAKQGALRLNATATGLEICSGVSWGPLTAVAAGSSDRIQDTGNNTSIDVDTDGLGGDDTIVFTNNAVESMRITADGDVVIGDTTASLTLLLDVAGQIGATEYCDADGLNCFDHTDIGASVDWDRIVNAMTLDANTTIDMNTNTATLLFDNTDNLLFIDGANNNIAIGSTTVSGTLALDITGDIGATSYCDADGLNCFVPTDVGAELFTDNTTYITRENFHILDSGQTSTTASLDGDGLRSFYDPDKAAFRGGLIFAADDAWQDVNIGNSSFTWGHNSEASNTASVSFGIGNTASGEASFVTGRNSTATANSAITLGNNSDSTGFQSISIGDNLTSSNNNSVTIGTDSQAQGRQSITLGSFNRASGFNSFAFGHNALAGSGIPQSNDLSADAGNYSMAFGLGNASTASLPKISGNESAAFFFGDQQGEDITATNVLALEGGSLLLSNDSGTACVATKQGALRLNAGGTGLEMCDGVSAWTAYPAPGGISSELADVGSDTRIQVDTSGTGTDNRTVFTNNGSESMRITSDGDVVIGDTTASAALLLDVAGQIGATEYCDADGLNCFVATDVGGLFTDNTTHITRENFHILNAGLAAGSTTAGLDGDGTYSFYDPDKSALRGGAISGANDAWQDANIGLYSFAWGENVEASAYGSISMGDNSTSSANNAISLGSGNTSSGLSSVAIGEDTTASNSNAIAIGASVTASGASSFASGASTTAAGTSSFAMGQNNQANGDYSLAGGFFGTADGYASVSFGDANTADGYGSVALNVATTASGYASTALNDSTTASGNNAFSSGSSTTASGFNSIAFGREVRVGTGVAQTTDATADVGNYSVAFGLGNASTATEPQVTANETMAIFFGDQNGEDITATNVLALEGGSLLLSNDSGTACAAAKQGALRLNAGGTALEMCDGAGSWNAYPAPGGAASELADANNDTRIQVDTSGTGTDNRTVFTNNGSESMRITSDGDVVIGTTTPSLTLTLDVAGQIGATEYCDENGLNCFATTDMANLWAAGAGDDIYYNTGTPEVGIGTTSPDTILHVSSDTDDILLENNSTASPTAAMDIELNRSRAGGAVLDGDKIGGIKFEAIGSTNYETGAAIFAIVDGTPGNNDMPSRLEFHVADDGGTVSGSSIPTITISSDDHVGINDTDPDTYFEVAGSASVIGNLMMVSSDPDGDGDILMIEENGQIGINDATPNGTLMLDVDGQIGASEYCDNDGLNCVDAINIAGFWTDNTTHISRENFNIIRPTSNTTAAGLDVDGEYVFYDESNIAMRGGTITGGNAAWQDVNIGRHSFAWGRNVQASGIRSFAFGTDSIASNSGAFAMGINATASEANAISIGDTTDASADNAIAMGHDSIASGVNSNVLGFRSEASGLNSMVFGSEAKAGDGTPGNGTGDYSIAFGLGDVNGGFSTQPEITGTETMAIFFGDQQDENISATNVLALEGGSLLLSNDSGSACAANKDGALRLNATSDGLEMCDGAITTWVAFSGLWASGAGDDIYYDTGASQVGIGTSTPGAELDVVGDIQYTGVITDVSDRRLKENIQRLTNTNMLDQLIKIDGYTFQMIDRKNADAVEYGVIAQEMEKIFPTLVHTDTTEGAYKSVNYTGLITPIIEAIKELYNMVLDLKDKVKIIFDKISKLENENSQLRVEVDTLKQQNQDILKRLESIEARTSNDNKEASLGIKTHANGT